MQTEDKYFLRQESLPPEIVAELSGLHQSWWPAIISLSVIVLLFLLSYLS